MRVGRPPPRRTPTAACESDRRCEVCLLSLPSRWRHWTHGWCRLVHPAAGRSVWLGGGLRVLPVKSRSEPDRGVPRSDRTCSPSVRAPGPASRQMQARIRGKHDVQGCPGSAGWPGRAADPRCVRRRQESREVPATGYLDREQAELLLRASGAPPLLRSENVEPPRDASRGRTHCAI